MQKLESILTLFKFFLIFKFKFFKDFFFNNLKKKKYRAFIFKSIFYFNNKYFYFLKFSKRELKYRDFNFLFKVPKFWKYYKSKISKSLFLNKTKATSSFLIFYNRKPQKKTKYVRGMKLLNIKKYNFILFKKPFKKRSLRSKLNKFKTKPDFYYFLKIFFDRKYLVQKLFYRAIYNYFIFNKVNAKFRYSIFTGFELNFKPWQKFFLLLKKKKSNKTNKNYIRRSFEDITIDNDYFFNNKKLDFSYMYKYLFLKNKKFISFKRFYKINKFFKKKVKKTSYYMTGLANIKRKLFFLRNFFLLEVFLKKKINLYRAFFFFKRRRKLILKRFLRFKKKRRIYIYLFMYNFKFFIGLRKNNKYIYIEDFYKLNLVKSPISLNKKVKLTVKTFIKKFITMFRNKKKKEIFIKIIARKQVGSSLWMTWINYVIMKLKRKEFVNLSIKVNLKVSHGGQSEKYKKKRR